MSNQYGCVSMITPVVAVGEYGNHNSINYSPDGLCWTEGGKSMFNQNGWNVGYNGILWVAVG